MDFNLYVVGPILDITYYEQILRYIQEKIMYLYLNNYKYVIIMLTLQLSCKHKSWNYKMGEINMETRICLSCKHMFHYIAGPVVCPQCREKEEQQFKIVKEYLLKINII